jgi:hypothetical protein
LLALALDHFGLIPLAAIYPLALPLLILGAALTGTLSLAALCGLFYDRWFQSHKTTLLSKRREIRREEEKRQRAEFEAKALKRLDYLSAPEMRYLTDCLRKNEQSFTTWVYSPHAKNLVARGLVMSPGGTHHQDHWPFMIEDFAWEALLARKEEFIAKDDDNRRRAAVEEKERRERPRY